VTLVGYDMADARARLRRRSRWDRLSRSPLAWLAFFALVEVGVVLLALGTMHAAAWLGARWGSP
jgi:hypothetical protein